jgi:enamine deaminase RidA (YjgF/YER057c/UK114 family)
MTTVEHINPPVLHQNPGLTQVVTVTGPHKTVYIGGQNGVNSAGEVVGDDMNAQAKQAFANLVTCLEAAGAQLEHVINWKIYILPEQDLHAGFAAFQEIWGQRPNPPTISVLVVAGLANPDFLIEIEAVAVVPSE